MKPSAYIAGKYHKDDPDTIDGVSEGDIYVVMKPTKENIELSKELLRNYNSK